MDDRAEELRSLIDKVFTRRLKSDSRIQAFYHALKNETAKPSDVSDYAEWLGECSSETLKITLTSRYTRSGFDRAFVDMTIRPLFIRVQELVNDAACKVQIVEDKRSGIGLKPLRPPFIQERYAAWADQLVSAIEEENREYEQRQNEKGASD